MKIINYVVLLKEKERGEEWDGKEWKRRREEEKRRKGGNKKKWKENEKQ